MHDHHVEEIWNQVRFRALNEAVVASLGSTAEEDIHEYVCECGDGACSQAIHLTRLEYEAVRSEGARFVIALDHEDPEVEEVVAEKAAYATVEKLAGRYSRIAMAADPRL